MKRKLAAMIAASLVGCGADGAKEDTKEPDSRDGAAESGETAQGEPSGKITIWVWTDISNEIDAYTSTHPGSEIEQVIVDAGDYITKIQTTLSSGGELPDLVWGEVLNRGILFEMGILDELTAEPYNFDTSLVEESLMPTMTNETGQVLGIERSLVPAGLGYHRSLAKEYLGTDDPKELEAMFPTWESFIQAGKEVAEKSGGKVSMLTSLGDVYYMMNGQSKNPRISGGTIHKDAVLELFTKICEFRDAGIVSQIEQWTPAWYASFGTADSVFSPMPAFGIDNWIAPNEEDGESDWGLMLPPGGGFSWGGVTWGITKDSQNKELAWDFISWELFDEGRDIRFANEEIPSAKGYMTEDKKSMESPYFSGQKTMEVYIDEILPTIHNNQVTAYDYTDICTMEVVLSSLNADYSMTAEDAVEQYISEMQGQAPELVVE